MYCLKNSNSTICAKSCRDSSIKAFLVTFFSKKVTDKSKFEKLFWCWVLQYFYICDKIIMYVHYYYIKEKTK